jgi:dTDP-4-amino-4,6-dideoxygalactose transaminase
MRPSADAGRLAINGGPKAVTVQPRENWKPPKDELKTIVARMIDDGEWSVSGKGTPLEFEKSFQRYIGARYCLTQNNGTSALWSAYYSVGVRPGDEVIHPGYTWICSIAPAVHMGARPVFCEIDPETLLIDPRDMERRITPRTRAVSIVHLYGNVCDMDAIMSIARKRRIAVIEDCSHCHGAEWDGKKVGTIGDVGCFSMQGGPPSGKPIAGGEGGIVVTESRALYERILLFCHLNRNGVEGEFTDPRFKEMAPTNLGLKFRAHPWALGAGLIFLSSLDYRNDMRRSYRQKIWDGIEGLKGIRPLSIPPKAKPAGFYGGMHMLYQPEQLDGLPVGRFLEALRAEGVDMSHRGYELTHRLKLFAEGFPIYSEDGPLTGSYPGYPKGSLPATEEVHERILGMPTFIEEEPGYSDQVIAAIRKVSEGYRELF